MKMAMLHEWGVFAGPMIVIESHAGVIHVHWTVGASGGPRRCEAGRAELTLRQVMMSRQEGVCRGSGAWCTGYERGSMRAAMSFDKTVDMMRHVGCVSSKMGRAEKIAGGHDGRLKGPSSAKRVQIFTLDLALNAFAVGGVAD